MSEIVFKKRKEIDEQLWNSCVASRGNGLPYALSFYLDAVAENWGGLVSGNYDTVMPVVWSNKLGVKVLYQPYFCQQLGIFGKHNDNKELQIKFLQEAKKYPYVNIQLNPSSSIAQDAMKLKPRKNLVLPLNSNFATLKNGFRLNHVRNIVKAENAGFYFAMDQSLKPFQQFYLGNVNRKAENFKLKHEHIFKRLTDRLTQEGIGNIYMALNRLHKPVAAVFVIRYGNRLCAIINTSNEEGKKHGASHFLFSHIIERNSDRDLLLDFEGSSVPGIARFYEGFGAVTETYWHLKTHWFR